MMSDILGRIVDGLDIETFLVCVSEDQGCRLMLQFMKDLGFQDVDIVFAQFQGPGARIRARGYIHRPGGTYGWLKMDMGEEVES